MDLTTILLLCLITGLIVFDFVDAYVWNATITDTVWRWSQRYPVVPFLVGLVAGHLFWRAQ